LRDEASKVGEGGSGSEAVGGEMMMMMMMMMMIELVVRSIGMFGDWGRDWGRFNWATT